MELFSEWISMKSIIAILVISCGAVSAYIFYWAFTRATKDISIKENNAEKVAFRGFPKIPRYSREVIITEKIDGTNGCIYIGKDGTFLAGCRTRWITPEKDNYGFAKWAYDNKEELLRLGAGSHFGEWWGSGINRGYGLSKGERRFSLFNISVWSDEQIRPKCCGVVPVLQIGELNDSIIETSLNMLKLGGSVASPGFMNPEGIVIYHTKGNCYFKKTILNDLPPFQKVEGARKRENK